MISRIKLNSNIFKRMSSSFFSNVEKSGINNLGIVKPKVVYHNLDYPELLQHEVINNEGNLLQTNDSKTFAIDTGKFTGRSPNDKWIVKNIGSESDENIWWGDVNKPTSPSVFNDLLRTAINHFNSLDKCYVFDGFCGANPKSRKTVRFIHEQAWQQHFVTNMFIRPKHINEFKYVQPDFTIINACSEINKKWKKHNLNSEVAVVFNIEMKIGIILGTWYGGENKKGIFSLMNYWLPMQNIMSMHCSANVGKNGDSALFFGLSGTGKTTLSADPNRYLIGDDEHGWDDDGVFNLEGGCYAKTINLSHENEPEIYNAIKTNALLENVYHHKKVPQYFNTSKTENGRVSYPIDHIENYYETQMAGHPENIIFLTCDAFGVLPPVSILDNGQAMYHFLSGYTAKIAGTERDITEPQATFSACYGAAFMTLHPTRYADLLKQKLEKHNSKAFLVNTGWTGGAYGIGQRMSISQTRQCINSILDGTIHNVETCVDPIFYLTYPKSLPDIPEDVCNPRLSWENKDDYDNQALKLSIMFQDNFKQYTGEGFTDYTQFGPKIIL